MGGCGLLEALQLQEISYSAAISACEYGCLANVSSCDDRQLHIHESQRERSVVLAAFIYLSFARLSGN